MKLPASPLSRSCAPVLLIALIASRAPAQGGTVVETFPVNDGVNDAHDQSFGEFAEDVGGAVEFARYAENATLTGHYFARTWDSSTYRTTNSLPLFVDLMREGLMDLEWLDAQLAPVFGAGTMIPTAQGTNPDVVVDPRATGAIPVVADAWWNAAGGGLRQVLYWPYKINGGSLMICMGGDGSGDPMAPVSGTTRSLMVVNYYNHPSKWGTNFNRFEDPISPNEYRREFSRSNRGHVFAEAYFEGPAAAPWLGPAEQAIEAGDIVIFVQENYGMNIPVALARTQEAVLFVTKEWSQTDEIPGFEDTDLTFTIDRAYVHGNSFGQAMAAFLCIAQPQLYSGAVDWITSDLAFNLGDFSELQSDFAAALDRWKYRPPTENFFPGLYAFIDQLGCRFDEPKGLVKGWDLAALSPNRRAGDIGCVMNGHAGEHEYQFPGSWSAADGSLNTKLVMTPLRHRAHEEQMGVIPGVNEFSIFTGTEWSDMKAQTAIGTRKALVPSANAPAKPYPDPYSHTLRPVDPPTMASISIPNLLTQIDLRDGMDDSAGDYSGDGYRKAANKNDLLSIGQGIWPGYRDQMRVADLDGDGKMEVVFGNLDGYVHILEFAGSDNPADPFRLIDEWRSPKLGRAIFACDAYFVGSGSNKKAQLFFADGRGQIWRINANSGAPDSYTVVGGAPIASPDTTVPGQGKFLYDGSTPLLLLGDFDGNSGAEILVLNRHWDWSLYSLAGARISPTPGLGYGRLARSTRTCGPTDAYIFERGLSPADSQREVILTSAGHAWTLDRRQFAGVWRWDDPPGALLPSQQSEYAKVVPCNANGGASAPTHLLAFTSSDDRPTLTPPESASMVELWTLPSGGGPPVKISTADSSIGFSETMSFAWIGRPASGALVWTFAIANGTRIETFVINTTSGPSTATLTATGSRDLEPEADPVLGRSIGTATITSLECAFLENGSGGSAARLIYSDSRGRIYVMSQELEYLRDSAIEFGGSFPTAPSGEAAYYNTPAAPGFPSGTKLGWPSNRTLAQTPACDYVDGAASQGEFHFAEFAVPPMVNDIGTPAQTLRRFRLGKIGIGTGTGGKNVWTPFTVRAESGYEWDQYYPHWTRTLQVKDVDGVAGVDYRVFTETGVSYFDSDLATPVERQFQTSSAIPNWMGGYSVFDAAIDDQYPTSLTQGGRIFERISSREVGDYWYLGDFVVPQDPNWAFGNWGSGDGWWYARRTSNFMSGQIASNMQSAHDLSLGTSMRVARIRTEDDPEAPMRNHLVVGTTGGFVCVVRPEEAPPTHDDSDGERSATLTHISKYMGSYIVGLDVADLDEGDPLGDPDDEIVCGNWIDQGTYDDWANNDATKNRAHLYVCNPIPGGNSTVMTPLILDGDDLMTTGFGISSGVTGVKIDDVDGDGHKEIWCSDAAGYLFLFRKDGSGGWICVFRSNALPIYPGFYNNLHPVKDGAGKTIKLVVQSPGYTMLFEVDPATLEEP